MVVKYIPLHIRKSRLRKQARQRQIAQALNAKPLLSAANAERDERRAALDAIFGLWKERDDIPRDGLAYQLAMRNEWR